MSDVCTKMAERLIKVLERLDEAEALYGTEHRYAALGKVGAAFTSLALAYAHGVIDREDWKTLSKPLASARKAILEGQPLPVTMEKLDSARKAIVEKMVEVVKACRSRT